MTSTVASWATKEALKKFGDSFNSEDPFYYYDNVTPDNQTSQTVGRKKSKKKKGKKTFKRYKNSLTGKIWHAPGVSDHDNQVLASVRRRAWHLDMSLFHWCGFRFGWSAVLGLIPVVGDTIDCMFAFWILRKADQIDGGLPRQLRWRMVLNILVDFAIGLIPFLGDIADAIYKANTRNTWLLESYLIKKAKLEKDGQLARIAGDPEIGIITDTGGRVSRE